MSLLCDLLNKPSVTIVLPFPFALQDIFSVAWHGFRYSLGVYVLRCRVLLHDSKLMSRIKVQNISNTASHCARAIWLHFCNAMFRLLHQLSFKHQGCICVAIRHFCQQHQSVIFRSIGLHSAFYLFLYQVATWSSVYSKYHLQVFIYTRVATLVRQMYIFFLAALVCLLCIIFFDSAGHRLTIAGGFCNSDVVVHMVLRQSLTRVSDSCVSLMGFCILCRLDVGVCCCTYAKPYYRPPYWWFFLKGLYPQIKS